MFIHVKLRFEGSNFSVHERAAKTKMNLAPKWKKIEKVGLQSSAHHQNEHGKKTYKGRKPGLLCEVRQVCPLTEKTS